MSTQTKEITDVLGTLPLITGTNADMLDGVHNGDVTAKLINGTNRVMTPNVTTPGFYYWDGNPANLSESSPSPGDTYNFSMIALGNLVNRTKLLAIEYLSGRTYTRVCGDNGWSAWKSLAFTTDNVASSQKLQDSQGVFLDRATWNALVARVVALENK